jgi:hypothetical protein
VVAQRWHWFVIIQPRVFRAASIAVGAALLGKGGDGQAHSVGCRIRGGGTSVQGIAAKRRDEVPSMEQN